MRLLALFLLLLLPSPAQAQDFARITGPCDLVFPRDHGPHPGFKTEWWYYTGSMTGPDGQRFGFQFTIFRSQIQPSQVEASWPHPRSDWRANHILLGHAAVTDLSGKRHLQDERVSRAAANLAGWDTTPSSVTLFIQDWSLSIGDTHRLKAHGYAPGASFSYSLTLTPRKGPILHGQRGYSQKGLKPESASCYSSIPRMDLTGTLTLDGRAIPVTGQAWMDQEFSSAPLEPDITGWDWFSLRLSDGYDLMVFFLRTKDGTLSPASSGTLIAPDASPRHLSAAQLSLTPTGTWTSPRSKARYPSGWKLSAPGLELTIEPELPDQEMNTALSTGIHYWEGLVRAKGKRDGIAVSGEGYVELTGYDRPFSARY